MPRKLFVFAITAFIMILFYVLSDFAEARRMGGGRSFGSSPSYQRSAPQPTSPQRSTNQPAQQTQPAAPAPTRGWGGMLGGLLMGGLIGSLLFGGMGGLAGPGLSDILLVGAILFFVVRYLRSRKMETQSAGSTAFGAPYQDTYPQDRWGSSAYGPGRQAVTPPLENPPLPPGFDQAEFMKGAKAMYTRLQKSWDKRDLEDIRQFTSSEVLEEIRRQAAEDPHPSKTEILLVNAKLLEVKTQDSQTVASVLYDVLMRESADETVAKQVQEVWHFRCDEKVPGSFWVLEGIQQLEG